MCHTHREEVVCLDTLAVVFVVTERQMHRVRLMILNRRARVDIGLLSLVQLDTGQEQLYLRLGRQLKGCNCEPLWVAGVDGRKAEAS